MRTAAKGLSVNATQHLRKIMLKFIQSLMKLCEKFQTPKLIFFVSGIFFSISKDWHLFWSKLPGGFEPKEACISLGPNF